MTGHAEDTLRRASIAQVLNLALAVPAPEAARAEGLLTGEDCQILDLVAAGTAAVGAIIADERAVAEQEQVCVGVEQHAAGVASEAIDVPSITGCSVAARRRQSVERPTQISRQCRQQLTQLECLAFLQYLAGRHELVLHRAETATAAMGDGWTTGWPATSPHPLQGMIESSRSGAGSE